MSVIKTKQELDSVINKLRANEVSNNFSELRANTESNNYDWLKSYTAGEDLIKNAVAKYNLQKYRELSSSGSFEFSELAEQAAAATKKEEFTRVQRTSDRKYNLITANGKLLSKQWFEWVDYFHEGFAIVRREDYLTNFIDKQGKLLSNEWFSWVNDFKDGFAVGQRTNGEYCKIDKQGKIVVSNQH